MDVMFIIPPVSSNSLLDIKWENHFEFLGPEYILATLRENEISGCILDAENLRLYPNQIIEIIKRVNPSIIGLSVSKSQEQSALQLMKKIRKSGFHQYIIFGGYFPTLSTEKLLEQVDDNCIAIIGEGEHVFTEVAKAILDKRDFNDIKGIAYKNANRIVINKIAELESNLDNLRFPCRDTLDGVIAIGGDPYLISSRGCYGNCSFCSIKAFYKKGIGARYRMRSMKNLVDEIECLIKNFYITSCRIFDDNLFAGGLYGTERVYDFVNEMEKRNIQIDFEIVCRANDVEDKLFKKLSEIGLKRVVIGLESFNQNSLNYYGKNLKVADNLRAVEILDKYGIECVGSYIMFNPKSTFEEIEKDFEYFKSRLQKEKGINQLNSILATSTILSIDEGTSMYQLSRQKRDNEFMSDNYLLENRLVDKLKNVGVFLTIALKNNILKLVWIDKYVRKQLHDEGIRKDKLNELEILWYQLAEINLSSFGDFLYFLRDYNNVTDIDFKLVKEKIGKTIDRIIDNNMSIDSLIAKSDIDFTCLPRIWMYSYNENEVYHFLDLITMQWYEGDKLTYRIINCVNKNYSEIDIVEKLNRQYKPEQIMKTYRNVISRFHENLQTKKVKFESIDKRYLERLFTCIFKI